MNLAIALLLSLAFGFAVASIFLWVKSRSKEGPRPELHHFNDRTFVALLGGACCLVVFLPWRTFLAVVPPMLLGAAIGLSAATQRTTPGETAGRFWRRVLPPTITIGVCVTFSLTLLYYVATHP